MFKNFSRAFTPLQMLTIGFIVLILAGSILLSLPVSTIPGRSLPFIDALFTSASAVTTTGLIVVNTGENFTFLGQLVILVLFQIGGIGYITLFVLVAHIFGKRPSLINEAGLTESFSGLSSGEIKSFVKSVAIYTLSIEFIGFTLLFVRWMEDFSLTHSAFLALFYSVSAFCTAGFGILKIGLEEYRGDISINLILSSLSIAGGAGFFILRDINDYVVKMIKREKQRKFAFHTRFALLLFIIMNVPAFIILYFSIGELDHFSMLERFLSALFQTISASSTTGFNTLNIGLMGNTALFVLMILMFVGAAPGGSGGGIKLTTTGILAGYLSSVLKSRAGVTIMRVSVAHDTVRRALTIFLSAIFLIVGIGLLLTFTEKAASFEEILFETISAFGTVGLSTGLTPHLSFTGKILISITMLIGRLGPLAVGFSLFGSGKEEKFDYAEESVLVG